MQSRSEIHEEIWDVKHGNQCQSIIMTYCPRADSSDDESSKITLTTIILEFSEPAPERKNLFSYYSNGAKIHHVMFVCNFCGENFRGKFFFCGNLSFTDRGQNANIAQIGTRKVSCLHTVLNLPLVHESFENFRQPQNLPYIDRITKSFPVL